QGFGRRSLAMTESEVYASVLYQIGALQAFARAAGSRLRHVKPHGALYNDAARDSAKAIGIARAVKAAGSGLVLVGLPGCELEKAAAGVGIPYAREFFADRAYLDDGGLVPRSRPDSVILDKDTCVARTLRAVLEGTVVTAGGAVVPVRPDTVCLHGDNPEALAFAAALRAALEAKGIAVRPAGPQPA
ncbi:MAG TPA: 5-oxoprolinase subunit PxpA, partial [Magnetospirillaceae bacterium]|nr:5-oxoprolinase subunit PxpA [Magnetospirillaceae bacterium]